MAKRCLRYLLPCVYLALSGAVRAADSVAVENAKPGTGAWQLTNPASMSGANSTVASDYAVAEIQGYASRTSVNQGETINFYVRTINTNSYTLSIYRIGWYGGSGGRLMQAPVTLAGVVQPMPPAPVFQPTGDGLVDCNWNVSYSLTVPTDWVSGIYLVKLALSAPAKESYIIFVVRDDARNAPILVQASFATYQAYNEWGGSSLYTTTGNDGTTGPRTGYKVSYNRPFWRGFGAGDFLRYEINLVRWQESQGYDVTYATDIDTHQNSSLLLSHKLFLVVGHDEYWSWAMRDNVERGRDAGVHLGFLGGNMSYCQIRFEPSSSGDPDRTEIAYKDELASLDNPTDPRYRTTLWRNIRPEGAMMGVEYNGVSNTTPSDIVVTNASHWLFNGTGVSNGSLLPGVLGYETDAISAYAPAGTISVAHSPFPKGGPLVYADVSLYTAASGANVFAAGSIWWGTGLDSYPPSRGVVPAVQQVTANFISKALQGAGTPPAIGRLPATVTSSSAAAGYPASNAGDGNAATQWVASLNSNDPNNNNAWIQLDFGARMGLQSVRWSGAGGSPYPAWSPTNYSIQISDDAVTWQTVVTRSNSSPIVTGNEALSAQGRFLRMLTSKVGDGTGWSLSFFEFWAEGPSTPAPPPPSPPPSPPPPPPSSRLATFATLASAAAAAYPATRATDGNSGTQWAASLDGTNPNNNNAWIQWDLGSIKQIDRVKWSGATGTPYPAYSPTNYFLQVSNDGSAWTTVVTRSNSSAVINGNETINAQGRYVKFTSTKVNDGTGWSLGFYEIWAEGSDTTSPPPPPPPPTSGILAATVIASSQAAGYPATNAIDNNTSTLWVASLDGSNPNNNNAWIRLDFGSGKQINKVKWQGANEVPYPADSPTNYSIQVSDDGTNWTTALTKTNAQRVVAGDESINAQGRYLRLVTTKVNDGTGWSLGLFEFWAEGL